MRILMLGWELPPHNSGGLGVACYQLCKSLSKMDADIEFVLPYTAEHDIGFMEITPIDTRGPGQSPMVNAAYDSHQYRPGDVSSPHDMVWQQTEYERRVAKLVESRQFDILHAHDWLTFRAAMRVKELTRCPVILHVHSVESDRSGGGFGNPFVREIEAIALHVADRVIAVSHHTKRSIMRDYAIPDSKIEVVHNTVETPAALDVSDANAYRYLTTMKSLGYQVVVNVGRLTIQKGLPNLLRAFSKVLEYNPKTMLLIVGSGEQYHELIDLAAELGLGSNVIFAGHQRGKPWRDAFVIGDLFVMPSVSEPFGLTPLEAIGYGTPALISRQSGVSEVLRCCLKVDYWDTDGMANQICAALQNEPLRRALLAGAKLEHESLSWDKISNKIMKLYRNHMAEAAV